MVLLQRLSNLTEIHVEPGRKSPFDFKVKYRDNKARLRTPKHIHLTVDILLKRAGNAHLSDSFIDYVINNIILKVLLSTSFPQSLQVFQPSQAQNFNGLNQYGYYTIDFLLIVIELMMIQEKTNYPQGMMNLELFKSCGIVQ